MDTPGLPPRFQVLETLDDPCARGAWRARDTLLGREVLLKRPLVVEGEDTAAERERSMREARALARVRHGSVARLLDVLETEEGPLLVLEPIEGETLSARLERDRVLPPAEACALGIELASALEAVHALGIVHRGVSAANVVLRPAASAGGSRLLLTGFTFAKSGPGAGSAMPGTTFVYRRDGGAASEARVEPPHPAPEQLRGEAADARADVFGLGWVLYECLTGRPPFAVELEPKHWRAPRSPSDTNRDVPRALSDAVLRCLAIAPSERFAGAAAVRGALEAAAAATRGPGTPRRFALAGGAAVVLLAGFFGARALLEDPARRSEASPPEDRGSAVAARGAQAYAPRYAASRALLIGIGDVYAKSGFPPLPNAELDVRALEERLAALGAQGAEPWMIERLLGEQATHDAIIAKLRALAAEAGPDDKLFVYYAGHGEPARGSDKSGFVIPALAPSAQADPNRLAWVRFDEFAHVFEETKAKHVLVAMDCCYGGRLGEPEPVAMRSSAAVFEEKFLRERAHVVLTSGRANETVSDGTAGAHSPFAKAFLEQLARSDAAITTSEFHSAVQKELYGLQQSARIKRPTPGADGDVVFFLR
ncbi:MAG: caspase family protein [Planctomycetes bacterium]|nr:caspase family protein [Planctomycetota bacterium]